MMDSGTTDSNTAEGDIFTTTNLLNIIKVVGIEVLKQERVCIIEMGMCLEEIGRITRETGKDSILPDRAFGIMGYGEMIR